MSQAFHVSVKANDPEPELAAETIREAFLAGLTPDQRDWIRAHPIVRVGVDPGFPPFEFLVEGDRLQGISSDYLLAIEKRTGLRFEVQRGLVWPEVVRKAQRHEIDLLPAILLTSDRQVWLDYSQPYVSYKRAVIMKANDEPVRSIADLKNMRIGVQAASADFRYVSDLVPSATVVEMDSFANAMIDLEKGEIDAVVGNGPSALYYARQLGLEDLQVVAVADAQTYALYMGARRDWPELTGIINKVLDDISDAEKADIFNKWSTPVLAELVDYSLIWKTLAAILPVLLLMLGWAIYAQRQNRMLARAQEELLQASKLATRASEAKTTFLANMSHEMRTPLTSIMGFLRLILEEKPGGEVERNATTAEQSAKDMLQLVNDILDIARLESGAVMPEMAPVSLSNMISRVMDHIRPVADRKRLYLQLRRTGPLIDWIMMDEKLLRQILINLVGNAVKFTEDGGITIEIIHEGVMGASELIIKVHDTGVGIREADLDRILSRFERVEQDGGQSTGGTGIGLALSRDIAQTLGGSLDVQSVLGEGSTFSVRLPVKITRSYAQESTRQQVRSIYDSSQGLPGGIRIYVADDNAVNRMLLNKILGKQGCKPVLFSDGSEILKKLQEDASNNGAPGCDLVLMDVNMPVMDGIEAQRRIRKLGHSFETLPIIAVSANAIQSDMDRHIKAGMDDYVTKPIQHEELYDAILRHYKEG